jgi:hypothetical protein
MRQNARQCFQQHFDIEHSAARLVETIRETATDGRRLQATADKAR